MDLCLYYILSCIYNTPNNREVLWVYEGKEIVKPEELENTLVHAQYKAEDGKLHEEERDVL